MPDFNNLIQGKYCVHKKKIFVKNNFCNLKFSERMVWKMDNNQICSCAETLAIATIPMQEWCEPYPLQTALYEGTIFPCMNFLFFKAPLSTEPSKAANGDEKQALMNQIFAVSFAVNDLTLYLDTHPDCQNGAKLFYDLLKKRLELLSEYAKKYEPLTQFSMGIDDFSKTKYSWTEGAMPWEGGCI